VCQPKQPLFRGSPRTSSVADPGCPSPCTQVDTESNEIAGVFESIQPSDTDLGSKAPKDVKITGLWYGQLS